MESKNLLREVGKNIRFIANKSGVNARLNDQTIFRFL